MSLFPISHLGKENRPKLSVVIAVLDGECCTTAPGSGEIFPLLLPCTTPSICAKSDAFNPKKTNNSSILLLLVMASVIVVSVVLTAMI